MKQNPLFSFNPSLYDALVHYFIKPADIIMTFYDSQMSLADHPESDDAPIFESKIIRRGSDHVLGRHVPVLTFGLAALAFASSWGLSQHFWVPSPKAASITKHYHHRPPRTPRIPFEWRAVSAPTAPQTHDHSIAVHMAARKEAPCKAPTDKSAAPQRIIVEAPPITHQPSPYFAMPSILSRGTPQAACTNTSGKAFFAVDTRGRVLLNSNSNCHIPPASINKIVILGAYLDAVNNGTLDPHKILRVPTNIAWQKGCTLNVNGGDTITAEGAAEAMIVNSSNDMADLVSRAIAGSTQAFAKKENALVHSWGATNTNIITPEGLPAAG